MSVLPPAKQTAGNSKKKLLLIYDATIECGSGFQPRFIE